MSIPNLTVKVINSGYVEVSAEDPDWNFTESVPVDMDLGDLVDVTNVPSDYGMFSYLYPGIMTRVEKVLFERGWTNEDGYIYPPSEADMTEDAEETYQYGLLKPGNPDVQWLNQDLAEELQRRNPHYSVVVRTLSPYTTYIRGN